MPAQLGQLKTGQDGKGLLRIHLWCPTTFQGYGIEYISYIYISPAALCLKKEVGKEVGTKGRVGKKGRNEIAVQRRSE